MLWLYDYVDDDSFSVTLLSAEEKLDPSIPMFVDMQEPILPRTPCGPCIIFTSFQPSRYKELIKNGWSKIMPTWSSEEQEELFSSDEFCREFGADVGPRAFKNIEYFGGAIRHNILTAEKGGLPTMRINAELTRKGQDICKRYFSAGLGGTEYDMADLLVHRNPLYVDGRALFDADDIDHSFALPYVLRRLLQLNSQMLVMETRRKYSAGTFSDDDNGNEFELLCLHGFKISYVRFIAQPLTSGLRTCYVEFLEKEVLALNWRAKENYLKADILYIPPHGNLESGPCVL